MIDAKDLVQFAVGDKAIVGVDAARNDPSVYRYDIRGINSADAHLIAAAPAMYEALQFADGYLDGHMTIEAAGLPSPTAHWETLLDKIRAAIARAEGRSE